MWNNFGEIFFGEKMIFWENIHFWGQKTNFWVQKNIIFIVISYLINVLVEGPGVVLHEHPLGVHDEGVDEIFCMN